MPHSTADHLPLWRRLFAAGAAAWVLALGVFSASPALHAGLHALTDHAHDATHGHAHSSRAADASEAAHSCAIVLFSQGVTPAVDTPAVPAPTVVWRAPVPHVVADPFLASPRYLRQPERGPPAV